MPAAGRVGPIHFYTPLDQGRIQGGFEPQGGVYGVQTPSLSLGVKKMMLFQEKFCLSNIARESFLNLD